jgi:N-acyl-L-homoserine lactone synthetase
MIRYLSAQELSRFPKLEATMFHDRAAQFVKRLGWEITVNDAGEERDQYDVLNPTYVIWENRDGSHGGSMRFLPTIGRTMVEEHFLDLTDGISFRSPDIWECTRFCLSPGAGAHVAPALMLGGLELGLGHGLTKAIGVFDARMTRIYRRLGWPPEILGTSGSGKDAISAGLWDFDRMLRPGLLKRAGLTSEISSFWYSRSYEDLPVLAEAV